MTAYSEYKIQQEIDTKLTGDTTLMAMIDDVYDYHPSSPTYPYVLIGDYVAKPYDTDDKKGSEVVFNITSWSDTGNNSETIDILERLHDLLHDASLTITNNDLISIYWEPEDESKTTKKVKKGITAIGLSMISHKKIIVTGYIKFRVKTQSTN